jgi:acyl carrier protein
MDAPTDRVTALIYRAVDDINRELTDGQRLDKHQDTVLFGALAKIDSMALVSFIVAVEEQVLNEFGVAMTLADEKAMSMQRSPFRTLSTLTDYVQTRLQAV